MGYTDKTAIDQVMRGLQNPIPPVERSTNYTNGLWGSAFIMVVMVMVYMTMLVLSFWLLLNVTVLIVNLIVSGSILGSICSMCFFTVVLVAGTSVFIALLKPFFPRRSKIHREILLTPEKEPVLFEFVQRLCRAVGAPAPSEIAVDPNVNAGAAFVNGIFDQRLKLLIGLPLVCGLDTRQFAGVLAHEFGHFSQSSGMKLTYLVRTIDAWFADAVYSRDVWDKKVRDFSQSENVVLKFVFFIARGVVWVARLILLGLVYASHFFSSRLLQEMEFDADRHEARLSGSQNFAKTSHRMRVLQLCQEKTLFDLDHYRRMKQLPDNLPALLVDNERILDKDKLKELEKELLEVETKWHDSHPSDHDRIENAARENAPGTFQIEHPASILFSDFDGLCRVVTMQTYRRVFESNFDPSNVKKTEALLQSREVSRSENKAALRFVLDQFCSYDSFVLPRYELGQPLTSQQYKQNTELRRKHLLDAIRGYHTVCQQEEQVDKDLATTTVCIRLMEAGFRMERARELLPIRTLQAGHLKLKQLKKHDQGLKSRLAPFRQMMGDRVIDALEFLRSEQVASQIHEPANVAQEASDILKVWGVILQLRPTFEALFFELHVNALLLQIASGFMSRQLEKSLDAALARLHQGLIKIQQSTTHIIYPFEHGKGQISVSHYLLDRLPEKQNITEMMDAAVDLDRNLEHLLMRCIGRLGALAEKVETVFGFSALETPEEVKRDR